MALKFYLFLVIFSIYSRSGFAEETPKKLPFPIEYFRGDGEAAVIIENLTKDPGSVNDELFDEKNELIFRSFAKVDEARDLVMASATARIDLPFEKLSSVYFANISARKNWVQFNKEVSSVNCSPIEQVNEDVFKWQNTQWIVGTHLVFFISARSFVYDNHIVINKKEKWIASVASSVNESVIPGIEAFNKKNDQVVGIFHALAAYIRSIDDGKAAELTIAVMLDPRGKIPKAIVKWGARSWALDSYKGLVRFTEEGQYKIVDFFSPDFDPQLTIEDSQFTPLE